MPNDPNDEIATLESSLTRRLFDPSERFVAEDESLVSGRRRTVLCLQDVPVGAAHAKGDRAHEHGATFGARNAKLLEAERIRDARLNRDATHEIHEQGTCCRFRTFSDPGGAVYVEGVTESTAAESTRVIVVMGVSGAGKTLVGRALADALGWPFHEGDDYHSAANIEKMSHGIPLTDEDRAPWLTALHDLIVGIVARNGCGVLACSALKHSYRERLVSKTLRASTVRFVYLDVPRDVLEQRLRDRRGHFAPPELLDSQLATLEEPHDAVWVNGDRPPAEIVNEIRTKLGL